MFFITNKTTSKIPFLLRKHSSVYLESKWKDGKNKETFKEIPQKVE